MRRSFAVPASLALLLTLPMVNPNIARADPTGPTLVGYQQSTSYVIQRALSQRNVPFLYGGGNAAGPTRGTGLKANVVGFDASEKLVQGVRDGQIEGLVLQDPMMMGDLALRTAVNGIHGQKPPEVQDTGSRVAGKGDLDSPEVKALLHPDLKKWLGE